MRYQVTPGPESAHQLMPGKEAPRKARDGQTFVKTNDQGEKYAVHVLYNTIVFLKSNFQDNVDLKDIVVSRLVENLSDKSKIQTLETHSH